METVAFVVMAACGVLAAWGMVKVRQNREELDQLRRLADLDRLDARVGRLRRPSQPS